MVSESQNVAVAPDSISSLKLSVKMCLYLNCIQWRDLICTAYGRLFHTVCT